ncbi:MAG: hypothetical protein V1702_01540 [Candidatus Woesearchaeota archaeon]
MRMFIIIIGLSLLLLVGCSQLTTTSLKEYRLNPDKYVNTTITINNKMIGTGSPDGDMQREFYGWDTFFSRFVDDEGYFVNVISTVRSFEQDKIYEVTGNFTKTSYGNYYLIEK